MNRSSRSQTFPVITTIALAISLSFFASPPTSTRILPEGPALEALEGFSANIVETASNAQAEMGIEKDVTQRFSKFDSISEVPHFQKHIVPTLSRLGCNGRACHGSFQGRGGFQLSLFGYDFDADHEAMMEDESGRIDTTDPVESLVIAKPSGADNHEGGKRFDVDSWEYNLLRAWIKNGAVLADEDLVLKRLEITPNEILFPVLAENQKNQQSSQLQVRAVAVWEDGTREDVTPLCRFESNDEQILTVDENGLVTGGKSGDSHLVVTYDKAVVAIPAIRPVTPNYGDKYPSAITPTRIDELVVQKLRKLGITQSQLCDDATFLRRVSLDLTGTLPSPKEITQFLADPSSDKRRQKIDDLLETDAYAAWWATKLNDFTGNSPQQLNNVTLNRNLASRQWYQWVFERVKDNTPYDEIVAGIVVSQSRNENESYTEYCESMSEVCRDPSGKKFAKQRDSMPYYWMRREFNDGNSRAISFAHSFLGIRIQCAQCHKHPFDRWTKDDFKLFAQLFTSANTVRPNRSREDRAEFQAIIKNIGLDGKPFNNQIRRELQGKLRQGETIPFNQLSLTPPRPVDREELKKLRRNRKRMRDYTFTASVLGGEQFDLRGEDDPREIAMQWLRSEENPYFATAFANRVWANYFNVGIINDTDDLNMANPPSNQSLMDYLAHGFINHDFDMKWLHREITNSRTYQLSWKPNSTNKSDNKNFSHSIPRRLPAEIVHDALKSATGNDMVIESAREKLTGRAISGAVLPSRNNNRNRSQINSGFLLSVFGVSSRSNSCDCDRTMDPSLLQTIFLKNDRDIHALIDRPNDGWLTQLINKYRPKSSKIVQDPVKAQQRLARQRRNLISRRNALVKQDMSRPQVQRQLEQIKKGLETISQKSAEIRRQVEGQRPKVTREDLQSIVQQAYLRTLSRNPTRQEMQRCLQYVQDDPNKLNAMRGILWALLNTKEFIVNH